MSLWPVNVHINFYFKGHVWTRSYQVRVATRLRELKVLMLENGQNEDVDSMEFLAYGERVPDWTQIWQEVTWDFNLLRAEIGALRAQEDRQQAEELGESERITTENFPCTECGTRGANNFGDGEFAYSVYCNTCWKAWGLDPAVEEEPVVEEPGSEKEDEDEQDETPIAKDTAKAEQDEKPTATAGAKAAAKPAAKGAAKSSAKALARQQSAGGEGAPKAAAKSAAAKPAAKAGAAKAAAKASAKTAAAPKELTFVVVIDSDLEMSLQVKAKSGSTLGELKAAIAAMGVGELPEKFSLGQAGGGGALPDDTALTEEHRQLEVVE